MAFLPFERKGWPRSTHFEHYLEGNCGFSLTVELAAGALRRKLKADGLKFYPTLIHLAARVINGHTEYRMALDKTGKLGYHDVLAPSYTVFHDESKTFSVLWTAYTPDFSRFYQDVLADMAAYADTLSLFPKPDEPATFPLSSVPWLPFTSFSLHLSGSPYLIPILTFGRFVERDGETFLPLALQMHHAVCDGYHAARFVEELQELFNHFNP